MTGNPFRGLRQRFARGMPRARDEKSRGSARRSIGSTPGCVRRSPSSDHNTGESRRGYDGRRCNARTCPRPLGPDGHRNQSSHRRRHFSHSLASRPGGRRLERRIRRARRRLVAVRRVVLRGSRQPVRGNRRRLRVHARRIRPLRRIRNRLDAMVHARRQPGIRRERHCHRGQLLLERRGRWPGRAPR